MAIPWKRKTVVLKLRQKNIGGFTLPEMLVVLCILVVMSLIAVPAFMKLLPGMRLNSSARQIYTAFARARQGAVSQNTDACVKFSQSNKTIEVWLDNGQGSAEGNGAKDSGEPYVFEGALDDGISIQFLYPSDTFRFNSRGLPKTSTSWEEQVLSYWIYLRNSESKYKLIIVTPTGGVRVS